MEQFVLDKYTVQLSPEGYKFETFPGNYCIEFINKNNGRFYTRDALSVWTNLGKHL